MRSSHWILVGILAAALLAGAGCGSDGGSSAPRQTETAALPTPAPEAGEVLEQFIAAAGAGDGLAMWALLSEESRARLGPAVENFAEDYAPEFQRGVGSFADTPYELVLAVEMPSGWAVAAVAGDRLRAGEEEYATYAVALRRQGTAWRIELGGPLETARVEPPSSLVADPRPRIAMEIRAQAPILEAGIWLDGEPFPGQVSGDDPQRVLVGGTPGDDLATGQHVVVVFGRTADSALAGSAPFAVGATAA